MGEKTAISWATHTWNAWWGCAKVSPGCDNCYAEATDNRYGGDHWGPDAERRFFGVSYWDKPFRWNRDAEAAGERARVFCSSMADLFERRHDKVGVQQSEARTKLWQLICETPWLDWLLLTKRPENFAAMLPWIGPDGSSVPWTNVWLGVTAENNEQARRRIGILRHTPAAKRFVSAEPLLEHITRETWDAILESDEAGDLAEAHGKGNSSPIDWLIVGDESGHGRRPADPEWVRTAREAAARHGVSFHFKQWAGVDAPGVGGTRKGPGGKIHLPLLDGVQHAAIP